MLYGIFYQILLLMLNRGLNSDFKLIFYSTIKLLIKIIENFT